MTSVRALGRGLAHTTGLLALRHRLSHRATLTVAMFHRVTVPGTRAAHVADPIYNVSAPLFKECLVFFRRHYTVVGLPALRASIAGGPALPPRSLLITFDDGWQDNLEVALPLLRQAGLSAAVFVAADALNVSPSWWWQEILLRALRNGSARLETLWAAAGEGAPMPSGSTPELALLLRYAALDPPTRLRLLSPYAAGAEVEGRHMITSAGLRALAAAQVSIGAHGAAHLPLSMMECAAEDLSRAHRVLVGELGSSVTEKLDAVSFPHGRYNAAVLSAAASAGFQLMFSSDACLNATPGGRPMSRLFGRISIEAAAISDPSGALVPSRLATWLFHRPVRSLGAL
jgi:peptidoglycan/xylan/chitin deacetylase (PgdA/CDA1 family)